LSVLNSRKYGLLRKLNVFSYVSDCGLLSREQIQLVCFGSSDYAKWKSRVELKKLYDEKKVRRGRCAVTADYVYYRRRMPDNADHLIQVNWVWVCLKLSGKLEHFQREVNCGDVLIADAYFVHDGKPWFLEMHREVNQRKFDKVNKYAAYFESGEWDGPQWPLPGLFARILVATETPKDAERIRDIIDRDNKIGLKFVVKTLDELKGGLAGGGF